MNLNITTPDHLIRAVENITEVVRNHSERLLKIEAMLAGGAPAPQAGSGQPWPSGEKKVHPSTLRAEATHAPPLTDYEIGRWVKKIPANRCFKKKAMAKQFFSDDLEGYTQAQRVCYWLKRAGILKFNSDKFEYYRPVPVREPTDSIRVDCG